MNAVQALTGLLRSKYPLIPLWVEYRNYALEITVSIAYEGHRRGWRFQTINLHTPADVETLFEVLSMEIDSLFPNNRSVDRVPLVEKKEII